MSKARHFIAEDDLTRDEFFALIKNAIELKASWKRGEIRDTLRNRTLAMIFEKASTRTRTSFEAGMVQLGGHAINLSPADSQLGQFASVSTIPVINGLSDQLHPCQLLADMQTFYEIRGSIEGATITWVGAGNNNMCNSFINTAKLLGFTLNIACPSDLAPDDQLMKKCAGHVHLIDDVMAACDGTDAVVTDVWASMGQESDTAQLANLLNPYQVDDKLMQIASKHAIFMHCLPAHRGEEVTASVIDGPQSVVWQEAGNRLHAQKALLEMLVA